MPKSEEVIKPAEIDNNFLQWIETALNAISKKCQTIEHFQESILNVKKVLPDHLRNFCKTRNLSESDWDFVIDGIVETCNLIRSGMWRRERICRQRIQSRSNGLLRGVLRQSVTDELQNEAEVCEMLRWAYREIVATLRALPKEKDGDYRRKDSFKDRVFRLPVSMSKELQIKDQS